MPYPKSMVEPMRKELTRLGIDELTAPVGRPESPRPQLVAQRRRRALHVPVD
jgi:hypothetical protein